MSSSSGKGAPPRIKRFPADECDAALGEIPCPVYHKGAHRARSSKGKHGSSRMDFVGSAAFQVLVLLNHKVKVRSNVIYG